MNAIAKEITDLLKENKKVPPGMLIKAVTELNRQQKKLESASIPWAELTDRLKRGE